ncbi:MAG: hypothetical protein HOO99_04090 [Hyphomicrobiaceae bacterium]|nr:hypothetical protein [Hyphomicrobiaceae bacterium]
MNQIEPRTLTDGEIAAETEVLNAHRYVLRLLNSGAGGISQLRGIVKTRINESEARLGLNRTSPEAGGK